MSGKVKYFTKSAFKEALNCPARLNFYQNDGYANQNQTDDFLKALADGGFQVEELAKIYHDVPPENDLDGLDTSDKTDELMKLENVTIAEATFKWGKCSVRADLIKKTGNKIKLIEIKAKSWGGEKDKWTNKNGIVSNIKDYVYDVAFQKYVITNYLKERFPEQTFTIEAALLMADKSRTATHDHINQYFKIDKGQDGKTVVCKQDGWEKLKETKLEERVLTVYNEVNALCDAIIAGTSPEQASLMRGYKFKEFVEEMSGRYVNGKKSFKDCKVSTECFKCPYYATKEDLKKNSSIKDGYDECWAELTKDFPKPYKPCEEKLLLESLWGGGNTHTKGKLLNDRKIYLDQITQDDLKVDKITNPGLQSNERKKLQVALATGNLDFAGELAKGIKDGVYLDVAGIKEEMSKWEFPLHMIDFETTSVALPLYKGMKPYEQVAFQFSHHKIDKDASGKYTIEHATQWINDSADFPNFDFVRHLKNAVGDKGTIFRYATHENSILRTIREQLEARKPDDYGELIEFIDSITHAKGGESVGDKPVRDMVDLCEIVKRYYYDPIMGGSNSIKAVLPAVLKSDFLFEKYSKPIYGSEIKSQNFTKDNPKIWIETKGDNPYKHLDSISKFFPAECRSAVDSVENSAEENGNYGSNQINNGGAALWAYGLLQFKLQNPEEKKALLEALYRYCELDTLSMVFVWEYFNNEVEKNNK